MGYGELIRSEEVAGEVFRLMRTEHGYAISYTSERFEGLVPPVRWLFRTDEAAQVGFDGGVPLDVENVMGVLPALREVHGSTL